LSLVAEETYLTQNTDLDMNDKDFYAEWHAQAPGKLSATIFTATLMAQSEDFRSLASYADDAFQEILTPFDNREMADEWKMYIPPAAVWIMVGGEALHYLCSRYGRRGRTDFWNWRVRIILMSTVKAFREKQQMRWNKSNEGAEDVAHTELERIHLGLRAFSYVGQTTQMPLDGTDFS
jgi:hypothetical protein